LLIFFNPVMGIGSGAVGVAIVHFFSKCNLPQRRATLCLFGPGEGAEGALGRRHTPWAGPWAIQPAILLTVLSGAETIALLELIPDPPKPKRRAKKKRRG
jgi:hypothetical protein